MFKVEDDLKWWHFDQNNSGGYFILNEDVLEDVFIQAGSKEEASSKAEEIFSDYSSFCECCGERWSTWVYSEGTDVPMFYQTPITESTGGMFHHNCVLYFANGDRKYYTYGEGFVSFEELNKEY